MQMTFTLNAGRGRGTMEDENTKVEMGEKCAPVNPEPIPGMKDFGNIKMQGVVNARDLGGMPTADGRRIARRRLLRSGDLHEASASDMSQLIEMHDMECVIDFRTDAEVEASPDPKPLMHGVEYMRLQVFPQSLIVSLSRMPDSGEAKLAREFSAHPYEVIQNIYRKCLLGEMGMSAYTAFLDTLLRSEGGATLWHCTQGKDRTGIAAILVEHALGVPEEYIHDDYLATNLFIRSWIEKITNFLSSRRLARSIDDDIRAYVFASDCYYKTVMDVVNGMFGSMDNYLTRALDFGPEKREKLREMYLQ